MGNNQNEMNSKKQPSKKVLDVSRPKKRTADTLSAPELVIPKRSIIVPVTESEEPVSEPIKARQAAEDVQPATDRAKTEPEQIPSAPEKSAAPEEPAANTPEESSEPEEPEGPDNANPKSPKADHPVRKALEDAKREQELQGYIENREFFVPINAVARKRSVKVTLMMVFVEFLLGLLLINLMLDAGLIHLLEKIPHTNFFDL
jgi:hypothetical protein